VARALKDPYTHEFLGVIIADARPIVLDRLVEDVPFNVSSVVVILDGEGRTIRSGVPFEESTLAAIGREEALVEHDGEKWQCITAVVPRSAWRIAVLLSNRELFARILWIYSIGALFTLSGIATAVIVYVVVSRLVIAPARTMIGAMARVQGGNLEVRVSLGGSAEFEALGGALNTMIAELKEKIDLEYVAVLNRRTAEYKAMQSQIKPHFLYNTLNGLLALNRRGESERLEESIFDLTRMLRYVQADTEWTTVGEEAAFVTGYCRLQQLRFSARLKYAVEVEAAVADARIPRLLLQPLVENSIIHGIEPLDRTCTVTVRASLLSPGRIALIVTDDGAGLEVDSMERHTGTGLSNTADRLRFSFPDSTFSVDGRPGSGTTIRIELPLVRV
jgi:two-component system sensor histidine kinase YesM